MTYRVAIDDIVGSFSKRIYSHKTGWARMQRCLVQDFVDRFPETEPGLDNEVRLLFSGERTQAADARTWMIAHDMAFSGEGYNLFGGWGPDIGEYLMQFAAHPNTFSLERPMPDLEALLRPRAVKTKSNLSDDDWAKVSAVVKRTPMLEHIDLFKGTEDLPHTVVLGDSHALAQYARGRLVLRNDGLTLHRLLEDSLRLWLGPHRPGHLVVVAGSIDLRHHLLRMSNPQRAVALLYASLRRQLTDLQATGEIMSFQVVMPYPVEFEGRRIPQTGFYKHAPFFGSQQERADLLQFMIHRAKAELGEENVFKWPERWYAIDPEQYATAYMERPGSVHLSPEWHLWDYETNQVNERLKGEYA